MGPIVWPKSIASEGVKKGVALLDQSCMRFLGEEERERERIGKEKENGLWFEFGFVEPNSRQRTSFL